MDSEQLVSDAKICLTGEFAKRGISAERIRAFREEEERRRTGTPQVPALVTSTPLAPGKDSYTLGPPLPAETPKAPWRPKTAGRISFFFGPMAGAQIIAISLRRMDYQQAAKKVILLALGLSVAEAAILFFIPDALSRAVAFGAEITFYLVFPALMEKEFAEWEASHPGARPSSGWTAIGWGLAGIVTFLVIALVVVLVLVALIPARQ